MRRKANALGSKIRKESGVACEVTSASYLSGIHYCFRQILHVLKSDGTKVGSAGYSFIDAWYRHPAALLDEAGALP